MLLHHYGTLDPVQFKITLAGANVTGLTLADADLLLYIDGVLYSVDAGEIGTEVTEIGRGWYKWTPILPAQTSGQQLILDLYDTTGVGTLFDNNGIQIYTGGHSAAFFGNVPP